MGEARPTPAIPRRKAECTRDPAAGPGTCWWWWEGCPEPQRRLCFALAVRTLREAAHV